MLATQCKTSSYKRLWKALIERPKISSACQFASFCLKLLASPWGLDLDHVALCRMVIQSTRVPRNNGVYRIARQERVPKLTVENLVLHRQWEAHCPLILHPARIGLLQNLLRLLRTFLRRLLHKTLSSFGGLAATCVTVTALMMAFVSLRGCDI